MGYLIHSSHSYLAVAAMDFVLLLVFTVSSVLGHSTIHCPESQDGRPVYIAHPTDCTKFYLCQGNTPVLMSCPNPLFFDPTINVCNFPDRVDCQQPTTLRPTRPTTTTISTTTTVEPVNTTTTEDIVNTTTTEVPMTTTLKPVFNTTTLKPITATEDPTTTIDSNITMAELFDDATNITMPDYSTIECKESPDGSPVYIAHPTDCTKFYECQGNTPILMSCPDPLFFDPTINACNYPDRVDCQQATTSSPTTTTTEGFSTTTEEPFNTTTVKPVDTTTTGEPIYSTTTLEPVFNTTTTLEPVNKTTTEEPIYSTTTMEPFISSTTGA